jgi:hypothetical protein
MQYMAESSKKESRNIQLQMVTDRVFNDDLMIALAVILAGVVILQFLFKFSSGMQVLFEYLNYIIIAAFVAEYALKLYLSKSRASFATKPLHVLDLFIILLALLDFSKIGYFSILSDHAQLSPILRLTRVFLLVGRIPKPVKLPPPPPQPELQIATLDLEGGINGRHSKEIICSIKSDETPVWIDIQHIKETDLTLSKMPIIFLTVCSKLNSSKNLFLELILLEIF